MANQHAKVAVANLLRLSFQCSANNNQKAEVLGVPSSQVGITEGDILSRHDNWTNRV